MTRMSQGASMASAPPPNEGTPPPRPSIDPALVALDPRDERLVDGAARWMGMLGRFQVLFGGLVLLLVLGAGLALWLTDAIEDGGDASATTPPLVTLGEVEPTTLLGIAALVVLLGGVLLRGGTLLIDAAEDFERHLANKAGREPLLVDGMRRLGSYFILESLIVGLVLGGLIYLGVRP
jgi:hypothetical protein